MYQIAFSLTLDLDEKLTSIAGKTRRSKSFHVREALQDYLDKIDVPQNKDKNSEECILINN